MADFSVGELRSWAKKMKYPDMIDLHRMETSHREIPPRCIPFLQWLTTLSLQNSIVQLDMNSEEFDSKFKLNASARSIAGVISADTQIEHNSDEEFDSIDELQQELSTIEIANMKMKRKILCVTNKIKETNSALVQLIDRKKKKASHSQDCLKVAREMDLAVHKISTELNSLPLKSREKFDGLLSSIDEIVKIEMTLLRKMAATSTSAPKQNELVDNTVPDSSQSPLTRGMVQSLNSSLKCETRSFLALESGESPEQEAAAKKLYTNQLQETRLKLLEVFYLAKVKSARFVNKTYNLCNLKNTLLLSSVLSEAFRCCSTSIYLDPTLGFYILLLIFSFFHFFIFSFFSRVDAEIKFRRGWRRSRGGTDADGMSSSRRSSNMSTCDMTEWGTMRCVCVCVCVCMCDVCVCYIQSFFLKRLHKSILITNSLIYFPFF